jgi:hypothetical protein
MPKKVYTVFLILFSIALQENRALGDQVAAECMIYNDGNRQYLYRAMSLFPWYGNVYTWAPHSGFFKNPYDTKMIYTEKDPKGIWYLEPAQGFENMFFLRNKNYDDYLHSSRHRVPGSQLTEGLRFVFTDEVKQAHLETYLWRLEKVKGLDSRYTIKNIKYDEPLVTTGLTGIDKIATPGISRRLEVYTLGGPTSQTWTLRCKDDILPALE